MFTNNNNKENNKLEIVQQKTNTVVLQTTASHKPVLAWHCQECNHDCVQIREECRCICGHRLKEHKTNAENKGWSCKNAKCKCKHFFYIVAEGAWILRCRCKHAHTDHDCTKANHPCAKEKCACKGFDSPFVCNCNHGWKSHEQQCKLVPIYKASDMADMLNVGNPEHVQRSNLLE